jgi:hypothetical protein
LQRQFGSWQSVRAEFLLQPVHFDVLQSAETVAGRATSVEAGFYKLLRL